MYTIGLVILLLMIASSLRQLLYLGRLNTQTLTAPSLLLKMYAYLPGARTLGPSSTQLLCLKLRGVCCHLFDILVLVFS